MNWKAKIEIEKADLPRVVFFGTPDFAVSTLESLARAGFIIRGIVTQPDRPAGRGQKVTASPVKSWALGHQIPLAQPDKIKGDQEIIKKLAGWQPQVIVVVAYGLILPQEILDLPPLGCVNLHPSLLPKYRGASPIETAILNGESETAVTTILMDAKMDAGPILLQEKVAIEREETAGRLADRLALQGAGLVVQTLKKLAAGQLTPRPQNEAEASCAPLLKKEDGLIDWQKPAQAIFDQIRAFLPKPGPYTFWQGQRIGILAARQISTTENSDTSSAKAGEMIALTGDGGGKVAAGRGRIIISRVKPAGKKEMTLAQFAQGRGLKIGDVLG